MSFVSILLTILATVIVNLLGAAIPFYTMAVYDRVVPNNALDSLWVLTTAAVAFVLFRFFDAVKPGPVGWADRAFKGRPGEPIGWRQGFGILFDDLVAAGCTLLVYALAFAAWRGVVA